MYLKPKTSTIEVEMQKPLMGVGSVPSGPQKSDEVTPAEGDV